VPKSLKNGTSSASLAQSKLRQRVRAACCEQQAGVFACCGALCNQIREDARFPGSVKLRVSVGKSAISPDKAAKIENFRRETSGFPGQGCF